tara:strand:+ start:139 stop:660 length:522 start_codon:yes stop_codon:yes gene_type:complete
MSKVAIKKNITRSTVDNETRVMEIGILLPTTAASPYGVIDVLGKYVHESFIEQVGDEMPELARPLTFMLKNLTATAPVFPQPMQTYGGQNYRGGQYNPYFANGPLSLLDTTIFVSIDETVNELMADVIDASQNENFVGFSPFDKQIDAQHRFFGLRVAYSNDDDESEAPGGFL